MGSCNFYINVSTARSNLVDPPPVPRPSPCNPPQVHLFGYDVSVFFKNARRVVVTFNLALLFLPIILVYAALGTADDVFRERISLDSVADAEKYSARMGAAAVLVVASYSAVFLVPIAVAITRKTRATTNQTDVVDGTFCFRPHYKMRLFAKQPLTCNLNTANLSTLGGVAIEFLLHSFYCLPKCQLDEQQCGDIRNFQLPRENLIKTYFNVQWRYVFWVMFCATIFNASVFVLHGVLSGRKKHSLSNHFWLWQFVWVLNGPAFVTIVMTLFQTFSCTVVDENADAADDGRPMNLKYVLMEDTEIACYSALHKTMCVAALVGLNIYLTQAALLPSGTYKETMRNKLFDILYVPSYLAGHFFLKALFAAVYVLFFRLDDSLRIPPLLMVNISLLLLNMRESPCAVKEINTLRTATLACTVWAGIASLLFVTQLQKEAGAGPGCGGEADYKGFLPLLFLTGWLMIFSGAGYIAVHTTQPIDSVLAHTFLELDRQVDKADKAAHSGPLLGLDGRPLTLEGEEVPVGKAVRDWPATCAALRAELEEKQEEPRYSGPPLDLGGSPQGAAVSRRKRGSVVAMLGLGSLAAAEPKALISDEDLERILALNLTAKLGSVAPRVLEPLISLTLSDEPTELIAAARYIRQLVWCTSINYPRVQFQALWALANLAQKRAALRDPKLRAQMVEACSEAGLSLEERHADLGSLFREMIVSTDYIMRSSDDDAIDAAARGNT